jgi:hypothetical protein
MGVAGKRSVDWGDHLVHDTDSGKGGNEDIEVGSDGPDGPTGPRWPKLFREAATVKNYWGPRSYPEIRDLPWRERKEIYDSAY